MKELSEKLKRQLFEEAKKDFPDDEMMQEIHYIRLIHYHQIQDLSSHERIDFFENAEKEVYV